MKRNVNAVAIRYSKALFDALTSRAEDLGQTAQCLKVWQQIFLHPQAQLVHKALIQPQVSEQERQKLVDLLFSHAPAPTPLLKSFLTLLVARKRMSAFSEIVDAFCKRVDEFQGVVRATMVTPQATQIVLKHEIEGAVKQAFHAAKVELKQEVDPSWRAGVLIRVGSLVIDATLKRRIKQFQEMIS